MFPSEHFILLLVFYPLVTLANNSLALLLFAGTIKWATGCSGGAVDKDGVIRKMFVHCVHSDMKCSHWSHWCFINTPRDCDVV